MARETIIVLAMGWLACPLPVMASGWQIIAEDSQLTFEGTMLGIPVIGVFERFSAEINFDPAAPEKASVTVTIDMTAINSRHDERDLALRLPEWFSVLAFPEAHFSARGFKEDGPGHYVTSGTLTVRGVSRNVTLPFDLHIENGEARMTASLDLQRDDFRIGQGEWASNKIVSYGVQIDIHLSARRVP